MLAGLALAACISFTGALSASGAPPDNDSWASALTLTGASGSVSGTNVEATVEAGEDVTLPGGISVGNTVWWKWVAPSSAQFTFVAPSDESIPTIAVFTGSSVDSLTEVASDSDAWLGLESRVFFDADAGTTYYIQVGSYQSYVTGAFTLEWEPNDVSNDAFAGATHLPADDGTLTGWNVGATIEPPDEQDPFGDLGNTVWYSWTPAADGQGVVGVSADYSRPALAVYKGTSLASLELLGSDVSGGPVRFDVEAGTTYFVQIGTDDSSPGTFLLSWGIFSRPDNDNLADARDVLGGGVAEVAATYAATLEQDEPTAVDFGSFSHEGVQSVWYRWTPQASGPVVVSVEASSGDDLLHAPLVQLFEGPALDPTFATLVPLGTHDPPADDSTDTVHAVVDESTTYYIQVMADLTSELDPDFVFTLTAQFDNDLFANATSLDGAPGAIFGSTAGAGAALEDGEPDPAGGAEHTVWYRWTAPVDGAASFSFFGSYSAAGAVYTGDALDNLVPLAHDEDSSELSLAFDAVAGTTYLIQLGTYSDTPGTFSLFWSLDSRPSNDDWADAFPIPSVDFGSVAGENVGATVENGEPVSLTTDAGPVTTSSTVWYSWEAPLTGSYAFDTVGSDHDTVLGVFTGSDVSALTEVAADDNSGGGGRSRAVVDATAGTTYYIQVGGVPGSAPEGSIALNWAPEFGNDNFADVKVLEGDSGSIFGANVGATLESGEPNLSGVIDDTLWYAWTPSADGEADLSVEAAFDPALVVYTGSALGNLTPVTNGTGPGGASIRFAVSAGTTYYVQLGTYDDDPGLFSLFWSLTAGPSPPQNDDVANAATLVGASGSVGGTTVLATLEGGEPDPVAAQSGGPLGNSVWFEWTPSMSGAASFELDAGFSSSLAVYTGDAAMPTLADLVASAIDAPVAFDAAAGQRYLIQVATDDADPDAFTLGWSSPRTISGGVLAVNGSSVPGVLVRACRGAVCEDTTSNSDGVYGFSDLVPGAYVVRALPDDPALLAVQAEADVTLESVEGLDLRFTASAASSTESGPSSFLVNGCVGGSLHYVATGDGVLRGSGDVADGAGGSPVDGAYTIDVTALDVGHVATLRLDVTIDCGTAPTETQTVLLFTDPSGTVVDDAAGGAALAGATVTLLDANGAPIPAGDRRLSPATASNPETSDARGGWAWDVAPGTYFVRAQKTDCGTTTSGALVVTPTNPVANVVLHLSCGTAPAPETPAPPPPPGFPPTNPPPSTLPDPIPGVSFNVAPISGTVLVNGAVLPAGQQLPFGATIDATNGVVAITTIGPTGAVQTAYFFGGVFQLLLDPDGVTNLAMRGGDFTACPVGEVKAAKITKAKKAKAARAARAKAAKAKAKKSQTATVRASIDRRVQGVQALRASARTRASKVVRSLWGTGKGRFRTSGRFSSATVRGTLWYTADRCDGTFTRVTEGAVTVLDFARGKVLIVRPGHPVVVKPE